MLFVTPKLAVASAVVILLVSLSPAAASTSDAELGNDLVDSASVRGRIPYEEFQDTRVASDWDEKLNAAAAAAEAEEDEKRSHRGHLWRFPSKRYMRFGRRSSNADPSDDYDSYASGPEEEKRYMRFGKRYMRFGRRVNSRGEEVL